MKNWVKEAGFFFVSPVLTPMYYLTSYTGDLIQNQEQNYKLDLLFSVWQYNCKYRSAFGGQSTAWYVKHFAEQCFRQFIYVLKDVE